MKKFYIFIMFFLLHSAFANDSTDIGPPKDLNPMTFKTQNNMGCGWYSASEVLVQAQDNVKTTRTSETKVCPLGYVSVQQKLRGVLRENNQPGFLQPYVLRAVAYEIDTLCCPQKWCDSNGKCVG